MSDSWNTPRWIADLVGEFDIDPASSPGSHIKAKRRLMLESGDDGLTAEWAGSCWVNPPYSKPLPWCERLRDHSGPWCALVKLDPTTRSWAALMEIGPTIAPFRKRIRFEGPKAMTANFPSVLVWSCWRPPAALRPHLWLPTYQVGA